MFLLICLLAAGAEVSATTPRKQPPGCPFPSGPYVPPNCGPNAYFEVCSYPCPPQNCSTLWTKYRCKEECCKPECRCKDGFLRDDKTGLCIDRDECFAPCGPLERFVRGSTKCQKTCANYKVSEPQCMCKPFTGCVCKSGRVRLNDDATGPCVLPKQCPSRRCPLREHWEECPRICLNETCISKSPDFKCLLPAIPLPCKPRCICDKGYLRNHLGQCIPENRCPVKKCPINEVWRCASVCAHDSCKRLEPGFTCPPGVVSVCVPACVCRDGYLRNDRGVCIPRELCPASLRCGINEVAVECATEPPRESCESVYTLYLPDNTPCRPGCDCRPGYLRDDRNICIPSEFCPTVPPSKCGPNQEYRKCGSTCELSCADLGVPSKPYCTNECVEGCFCKLGYLRDGRGYCIPRDECPLPVCPRPNEVAKDCGTYCDMRTCEDYKRTNVSCGDVCVRSCFCRDGYVRNAYGVCVPPEQCPPEPICLQANEEYLSCGSSCPDTCDNYWDTSRVCTAQCVPGCFCGRGYVRNLRDNTCVKPDQCPSRECTGLNEDYHLCASYCPVTCANRYTLGDWGCGTLCREGCDCIPGTLRADNGTCVPVEHCSPPVCRENERYLECGTACPLTCDNYKRPPACPQQCVRGCFCVDGYVRDRNMRCVKPENCEPICPAGEKYDECSAHCQDTCENYNVPNRVCTYQCQSGCVCGAGTVRRKDGACVPPSECSYPTCPADEVFDKCTAHCEPTCEHHEPDRPCSKMCKPGCRCRAPLVRRSDGKCVKLDQCCQTCPVGEKFDECYSHCQDTCENYNVTNRPCTHQCQPGCVCDTGTVRRKDGRCVPPCECSPPVCRENERYLECGTACPLTCDNYKRPPACPQQCVRGCFCVDGYVRDRNMRCVKPENCEPICPAGEKYDECSAHCQDTCENYNVPNRVCTYQCQSGCVCGAGTVRRKDGACVPPSECSYPTCPADEVFDKCTAHCEPTCEHHEPDRPCSKMCKPGCRCRAPLVRRSDGKCVKLDQCCRTCPVGEKFDECYSHCQDTCENYNVTNRPCTHQCQPGCVCDTGTVRRKDGRCVPPCECSPPVCRENERYLECGTACPLTCDNYKRPPACPQQCVRGCFCVDGYVRDRNMRCVKPENCAYPTCPADEVFDKCTAHCEPTCEHHEPDRPCSKMCKPGCRCRAPLVRRSDGKCVKLDQCCQTCPVGEKFDECYSHCQDTCENYNVTNRPCTHQCQPGCVCDTGTVRRKDGRCVPPCECSPPVCRENERYLECGTACPLTCENYKRPPPCTEQCVRGCFCVDGYVRDRNMRCVKPENCGRTCPVGEKFDECYSHCQDTCENYNVTNRPCTHQCQPGCVCDTGTVRRKDGRCVPPCECSPPVCRENERYLECGTACPLTCDNYKRPPACPQQCVRGCFCVDGYVRDRNMRCVKPENCAYPTCPADEVFDKCTAHCEPTCEHHEPDRPCSKMCKPGCRCRAPLVRRSDGKCVKLDQCCRTCPVGEKFDECYSHCQDTCENYNVTNRPCTHQCQPGCVCDTGTVRRKDGRCVPPCECSPPVCRENERYLECGTACPLTCDNYKRPPACPQQCVRGCFCVDGYVRDRNMRCVKPENCAYPTCPADEVFDKCTAHCEPTCEHHEPDRPCSKMCKPGCRCRAPLVRRSDGKCVKLDQCCQTCPVGEKFDECYSHCQDTCENYNVTNRPCTHQCQPGCVCDTGTVRRKDGRCVPPCECSTQICGPNEHYEKDRIKCELTCKNYKLESIMGPCRPVSGCFCDDGYVRDSSGVCIRKKKCPKPITCPPNEVLSDCYNTCHKTCKTRLRSDGRVCHLGCIESGCLCVDGYLRHDNGTCVPISQCSPPRCNANETYSSCGSACPPTCDTRGNTCLMCPQQCVEDCFCSKGLVRAEDGTCVAPEDCPPRTCSDPNEVFVECPPSCPPGDKCSNMWTKYDCSKYPDCCKPQCRCKSGYARNTKGKCITTKQCIHGE